MATINFKTWVDVMQKVRSTIQKNVYDNRKNVPVDINIQKVNVGDIVTAQKWNEVRSAIISEYKRMETPVDSSTVFVATVGDFITSDGFNNLRSFLNWYNSVDSTSVGEIIQAKTINQAIDALIRHGLEYCTCNCAYCTCNCNHCACNCAYKCTCNCHYEGSRDMYTSNFVINPPE